MTNARNYSVTLTTEKLNKISEKISNKNNDYSLITYNCATFATELWNIATGKSWWTGWFRTPSNIRDDIKATTPLLTHRTIPYLLKPASATTTLIRATMSPMENENAR